MFPSPPPRPPWPGHISHNRGSLLACWHCLGHPRGTVYGAHTGRVTEEDSYLCVPRGSRGLPPPPSFMSLMNMLITPLLGKVSAPRWTLSKVSASLSTFNHEKGKSDNETLRCWMSDGQCYSVQTFFCCPDESSEIEFAAGFFPSKKNDFLYNVEWK